jgi:hypothetical protein
VQLESFTVYEPHYASSSWTHMTTLEVELAITAGARIWEMSQRDEREDRWQRYTDNKDMGRRIQMLGAIAERAVAKAMRMYWPSDYDTFAKPDLDNDVEARLVGREHYGLRVYPRTPDEARVVGCVIPPGQEYSLRYRIPGWYLAADAKQHPEWIVNCHHRPPMFCVPQRFLRQLPELRRIVLLEQLADLETA